MEEYKKYGRNRIAEGKLPLCADVLFHQSTAGRGRQSGFRYLQKTGDETGGQYGFLAMGRCLYREILMPEFYMENSKVDGGAYK